MNQLSFVSLNLLYLIGMETVKLLLHLNYLGIKVSLPACILHKWLHFEEK